MMRMKKTAACLMAGVIACTALLSGVSSATEMDQENAQDQLSGEDPAEETEGWENDPDGWPAEETEGWETVLDEELAQELDNIDMEDLKDYAERLKALITSEEFRSLIRYPAVRELIKVVLKQSAVFVVTEQELTEEILRTAGVQETYIYIILALIRGGDYLSDEFRAFRESEEGQEIIRLIEENVDTEEAEAALEEICWALLEGDFPPGMEQPAEPGTEETAQLSTETERPDKGQANKADAKGGKANAEDQ